MKYGKVEEDLRSQHSNSKIIVCEGRMRFSFAMGGKGEDCFGNFGMEFDLCWKDLVRRSLKKGRERDRKEREALSGIFSCCWLCIIYWVGK